MNIENNYIQDCLASDAEKMRVSFEDTFDKIDNAIRTGKYESVLNTALVTVLYYPADLRSMGYHIEITHKSRKCKYAFDTLEVLLRRSFVILSNIAAKRGLDVAAIEAGQPALKDAFSVANGDGTRYGIDLPEGISWTDAISGEDWEKMPQVTRERLVKLQDALNSLNHSEPDLANLDDIPIDWSHRYLKLIRKPDNERNEPAIFKYKQKDYLVPPGKGWNAVVKMVDAEAFDGKSVEMDNPKPYFKRKKYNGFRDDIIDSKKDRRYWLKTR